MTVAIRATDLVKSYSQGFELDGVSLEVNSGVLVVMGPSGSGKSTLIRTFNGLESLDGGALDVLGVRSMQPMGNVRSGRFVNVWEWCFSSSTCSPSLHPRQHHPRSDQGAKAAEAGCGATGR